MSEGKGNPPVKKWRFGAVSVNVWKNSGEKGDYYTVDSQRGYKDRNGEWKNTGSLRLNDMPKAVLGINEAYKWILQNPLAKEGQ